MPGVRTRDDGRFPLTRAAAYPRADDPEGRMVPLACTHIGADRDVVETGRVTLFADAGNPIDPHGYEFDLEPEIARGLGQRLIEAADGAPGGIAVAADRAAFRRS